MKSDKSNNDRSALEENARALFQRSVEGTDGATRSRLNQARQRALAQRPGGRRLWDSRWLPVGAVAAAGAVALVLIIGRLPDAGPGLTTEVASDLEILLEVDDLELIEELEFYAWLDEQPELREEPTDGNGVG